jgi:hypothetical protein
MNALVFLCKKVLKAALEGVIDALRAPKKVNVRVVMTREEVSRIIPSCSGRHSLWSSWFTGVARGSWKRCGCACRRLTWK